MAEKSITNCLDWLQVSADYPEDWDTSKWPADDALHATRDRVAFLQRFVPVVVGEKPTDRPSFNYLEGYTFHWDFGYCSAFIDPKRPEQKIAVRFQGNELSHWRSMGYSDDKLIQYYAPFAKPSRIDIAFDFRGYEIDPLRIYNDWERGRFRTSARKVFPYTEAIRQPDDLVDKATTLYIGSRKSEFCFRIYEKGKQTKTEKDWTRLEIELKGDRAHAAMLDAAQHGLHKVGVSLLQKAITKCNYNFYRELIEIGSVPLTETKRKATNRELWLINMVLPVLYETMIDELYSNGGIITNAVETMMKKYRKELSKAIRGIETPEST